MKVIALTERNAIVEAIKSLPIPLTYEPLGSVSQGKQTPGIAPIPRKRLWQQLMLLLRSADTEWMGLHLTTEYYKIEQPGFQFGNSVSIPMGEITVKTLSTDSGEKLVMALIPDHNGSRKFACGASCDKLVASVRLLAKSFLHE
jgi:hypothetical protein